MFQTVPLCIIRNLSLYTQNGICHTGLLTACEQDQDRNLILLASCNCNLYDIYHCCVYSEKLLMMDRGTVWNM